MPDIHERFKRRHCGREIIILRAVSLVSPVLKRAGRLVPKFGEATAFLETLQGRLACLRSTVGFASKPGTGWPSLW